ncbi:MAG: OmpA family protein [Alphaproteobacteria bacterium]|nr:OmpA family protein [Alphaproteobacteria bacterium]
MVKPLKLSFVVLLSVLVVPFLAGCEKAYWDDVRNFRLFDSQAEERASASLKNVEMREDNGTGVTPMPSSYGGQAKMPHGYGGQHGMGAQTVGNVDLFDMGPPPVPAQQMGGYGYGAAPQNAFPQYGGGMASAIDSNVMIYDLDAPAQPMMGGAGMAQGGFQAGYQGQAQMNNYASGGYAMGMNGAQVYFNHGSSNLSRNDRNILSSVAEQAKFAPSRITVSGYASRPTQAGVGSTQVQILNLKQSMNRSFEVSKELIKKGVPADKIKAVAWGTAHATGTDTQDQRVDIMVGER